MSLDVFGAYPAYFRESRAEFTVAKDQNVRLRSAGLANGRLLPGDGKPVVAQTGLRQRPAHGEGLFRFQYDG